MLESEVRQSLHIDIEEGQFYVRCVVPEDSGFLRYIVEGMIEPIYGEQPEMVGQWIRAERFKSAWLAFKGDYLVGFLCLKIDPEKDYLKISTLLVLSKFRRSKRATFLLQTAENFAKLYDKRGILVTVSEERPDALNFFKTNGFEIIAEEKGKYKENVIEFILKKRLD